MSPSVRAVWPRWTGDARFSVPSINSPTEIILVDAEFSPPDRNLLMLFDQIEGLIAKPVSCGQKTEPSDSHSDFPTGARPIPKLIVRPTKKPASNASGFGVL